MDFTAFYNVVAGELRSSKVENGAAAKWLGPAPIATAGDVKDCVAAAERAFPLWAQQSYEFRVELLGKFADLYLSHAQEFCVLLASETGRTVSLSSFGILYFNTIDLPK